jgi:hypothetical protein
MAAGDSFTYSMLLYSSMPWTEKLELRMRIKCARDGPTLEVVDIL